MYPNLNSGIGNLMKNQLSLNPTTGRIFIVAKASLTTIKPEIDAMYGAGYPDGVAIVYTTIAAALASCVVKVRCFRVKTKHSVTNIFVNFTTYPC